MAFTVVKAAMPPDKVAINTKPKNIRRKNCASALTVELMKFPLRLHTFTKAACAARLTFSHEAWI